MKRYFSAILLLLMSLMTVSAQTAFLDQLRKIEGGKGLVVVMQSPEIDKLVNNVEARGTTGNTATGKDDVSHATAPVRSIVDAMNKNENNKPQSSVAGTGVDPDLDPDAAVTVDTRKKVMRNSYKTTGYRIQLFSGGNSRADRQKAEQIGSAMKRYFPTEPIYVHFYSPSWKCRMGNYRDQEEARLVLKQVKDLGYKQACLVKGTISVQY